MEKALSLLVLLSFCSARLRLVVQLRAPGTRYPCAPLISLQDPSQNIPANCELSPLGEIQSHMRGATFRENFIEQTNFMNQFYRGKQIISKAAPKDASILSASSFLQGLYPVTEFELNQEQIELAMPPINIPDINSILELLQDAPSLSRSQAIHTYSQIQNASDYILNAMENCPFAYKYLDFKALDPSFQQEYRDRGKSRGAFQVLSKRAGTSADYIAPSQAFSLIQDILSLYAIEHNKNDLNLTESELQILKHFYRFILIQGKLANLQVLQLLSSSWLQQVRSFLEDSVNLDKEQAQMERSCKDQSECLESQKLEINRLKLIQYSLEEERLFALMKLLNQHGAIQVIQPASFLRLSLLSSSQHYLIQIQYNDSLLLTQELSQFVQFIDEVTYSGDVEKTCKQFTQLRASEVGVSSKFSWQEFLVVLVLLVLTALSLVAFVFWYEEKKEYQPCREDSYLPLFE